MPAKKHVINLLPQQEFEASTWGRVLAWALSTFRIIVIATEMVVMVAFLSRFWLDARNSDLGESIKQKQALVSAQAPFEKTFRLTQKKLKIFAQLSNPDPSLANIIRTIASYFPEDVILTNFSFANNVIRLNGNTTSEISVQQLVANLKSNSSFSDVALTNLSQNSEDGSGILRFSLSISLKKKGAS